MTFIIQWDILQKRRMSLLRELDNQDLLCVMSGYVNSSMRRQNKKNINYLIVKLV